MVWLIITSEFADTMIVTVDFEYWKYWTDIVIQVFVYELNIALYSISPGP